MTTAPELILHLAKPWADFYSHSRLAETVVTFAHIAGLVIGGGAAVATDRATFRALRGEAEHRGHHLRELGLVHNVVLLGLAIAFVSGLLLFASDLTTFFSSWVFWVKMVLILWLLVNGAWMMRAERALEVDADVSSPAWIRLHRTAVWSVVLWFAITLFGVALVNIS
jgi:hypothetical protein